MKIKDITIHMITNRNLTDVYFLSLYDTITMVLNSNVTSKIPKHTPKDENLVCFIRNQEIKQEILLVCDIVTISSFQTNLVTLTLICFKAFKEACKRFQNCSYSTDLYHKTTNEK